MKLRHPERSRGTPMRKLKEITTESLDDARGDAVVVLADSDWCF
jgi:hypothetical protein